MSEIEQELRKAWKMRKKEDDFDSRQDYLVALIRGFDIACSKDDDLFDTISQEAADWFNAATEARNKKNEIDDFPDLEAEVAEEAEDEPEDEAEAEADDDAEEAEDEAADESEEAAESDEELTASEEAEAESENEEAEAQAAKKAKGKKPAAKQPKKKREPTGYERITGEKDRFGIIKGTKSSVAVGLYEKGASAKDIKEATGGKHYNVLTKLSKEGHKLEKLPGGIFRLTHKDDIVKPSKKGK